MLAYKNLPGCLRCWGSCKPRGVHPSFENVVTSSTMLPFRSLLTFTFFLNSSLKYSQAWWDISLIPGLRRQRHDLLVEESWHKKNAGNSNWNLCTSLSQTCAWSVGGSRYGRGGEEKQKRKYWMLRCFWYDWISPTWMSSYHIETVNCSIFKCYCFWK